MIIYADKVFLLNFLVDFFLLLGTNRLSGFPPGFRRCFCAAVLGGVYGTACLFRRLSFLGNCLWRTVILLLICLIAFGWNKSALPRGCIYILLSMALGGLSLGIPAYPVVALLAGVLLLCSLCCLGFRNGTAGQEYIPVTLNWKDREMTVIALKDTGNTLTDPLTGERVLVAGADIGARLFGLSQADLSDPVAVVASGVIQGARLIPYHAVGQPGSMMLAVRLRNVKIGSKSVHPLVAFAPHILAKSQIYQMLTGGTVT